MLSAQPREITRALGVGAGGAASSGVERARKTRFDLIGVVYRGLRVSLDSRMPNRLVHEALRTGDLEELAGYAVIQPEYGYGRTRFDFLLANEHARCVLEVKSCTLVRDGVALFPDAPTVRGRRHVRELVKATREGYRECMRFVVQRADADVFIPHIEDDPAFGHALRALYAVLDGVFHEGAAQRGLPAFSELRRPGRDSSSARENHG